MFRTTTSHKPKRKQDCNFPKDIGETKHTTNPRSKGTQKTIKKKERKKERNMNETNLRSQKVDEETSEETKQRWFFIEEVAEKTQLRKRGDGVELCGCVGFIS